MVLSTKYIYCAYLFDRFLLTHPQGILELPMNYHELLTHLHAPWAEPLAPLRALVWVLRSTLGNRPVNLLIKYLWIMVSVVSLSYTIVTICRYSIKIYEVYSIQFRNPNESILFSVSYTANVFKHLLAGGKSVQFSEALFRVWFVLGPHNPHARTG